MNEAVAIVYN